MKRHENFTVVDWVVEERRGRLGFVLVWTDGATEHREPWHRMSDLIETTMREAFTQFPVNAEQLIAAGLLNPMTYALRAINEIPSAPDQVH